MSDVDQFLSENWLRHVQDPASKASALYDDKTVDAYIYCEEHNKSAAFVFREWLNDKRGLYVFDQRVKERRAERQTINGTEAPTIERGESALALVARAMPAIAYINGPYVPEGLLLVASRPKLGKTTLARQLSAAASESGEFFGGPCRQTAVLFLQLEESDRLNREKINRAQFSQDAMRNVYFVYDWPRGESGAAQIDAYLTQYPDVGLVIVDSLTRFRTIPDKNMPAFVADYEAVTQLHRVAKAHTGVTIVVLHHTRKCRSDDPIDDISGTYGLTAACDSYWVLRHHKEGAELHIGGRLWDRDEKEYGLARADQRWKLQEAFSGLTGSQIDTLRIVRECGSITPSKLGEFLNIGRMSAYDRLKALVNIGQLRAVKGSHGAYEAIY